MLGRVNHSMSALIGLCGIMVVIFLEVAYVSDRKCLFPLYPAV